MTAVLDLTNALIVTLTVTCAIIILLLLWRGR